ncbi:MAG: hypothetical protein ABL932_12765 [Terricaulis sp.]
MQPGLALLLLFAAVVPIPSGFAAGYLGNQKRTADLAWFAVSAFAFGAGVWLLIVDRDADWLEHPASLARYVGGFLIGGFGLGMLCGFAARAFGKLGWIIGFAAAAYGFLSGVFLVVAWVFAMMLPL